MNTLIGTENVVIEAPAAARDGNDTRGSFPADAKEWFFRIVPAFGSLRGYRLSSLRADVLAGLTVATVAVPQAMAYAMIANLPPVYGLYTAIVMTAVGALFDSSRQLINGPTNAISIAVLSALAFVPEGERLSAAIFLAFMVGFIQTGITLLRLGDLTRYVSHSVVIGFTLGAAVLIVLDQLKNLLGLPARGHAGSHFLVRFGLTMGGIEHTHFATVAIGVGTIFCILLLGRLSKRFQLRLPELLIAAALMAFVVWLLDLKDHGVAIVGTIPSHLPGFRPPHVTWANVRDLSGSALAIALLGLLEAVAMAKSIAARTGQKLDINQQCLSEGLANLAGSFFHCYPGSGSLTRSAINVQSGAVSQWSGVFAAAAVAVITLLAAPLAFYIPRAALAGILLLTAWRLIDRRHLLYHLRTTRFDAGIVIATAFSAVFVSVEFCILIGTFLSFLLVLPRVAHVHLTELTITNDRMIRERLSGDPACERLLIFSLEGELFFGSSPELEKHFETIVGRLGPDTKLVVLRLKRVRNPDAVSIDRLGDFLDACATVGATVILCGVRKDIAEVLHSSGLERHQAIGRIFHERSTLMSSTLEAVHFAYESLGDQRCATCPRRGVTEKDALYYMI